MGIISNLFSPAPAPATPAVPVAPTPATPGNIPEGAAAPAPATPGTASNGAVPPVIPEPKAPDSPLAEFSKMWEPVVTKEGDVPTGPVPLDPVKLQEVVSKADFTTSLTPENLAAIEAGGEGAQKAFTESLNVVAQQVLLQSTLAANKMTEQAVKTAVDAQAATIPDLIRAQTLNNTLQKDNPIFSNPAVKPVIEAAQTQLAAKYPDATPAELAKMTTDYVTAMAEAFSPVPVTPVAAGGETMDWESHFLGQN